MWLVCQDDRCLKEFSIPPSPEHGWEAPPQELVPDIEDIGGVMALAPEAFQQAIQAQQAREEAA